MYAVAVVMVAMARTCTCNCQLTLRCGSAFLHVGITERFVLNVCKVVTFVLINVFDAVKNTWLVLASRRRWSS